jgi:hypothetical protein
MSYSLITEVQPALEFIPPAFDPKILAFSQLILPWYLHNKLKITDIQTHDIEILAHLYDQFNQGKTRFLIAFRHPTTNDPFCLVHLLWNLLPKIAKQEGINLKKPIHSHFVYHRGITIWAGAFVGWFFSRLGGTSIERGKLDRLGLRSIRDLMLNGRFPLAAAPEGGVNGHSELVSPLEPGIAQIGFWCLEDIEQANRTEEVVILPIGFQYSYIAPPWQKLNQLLGTLESDLALEVSESNNSQLELYQRLLKVSEKLLGNMETFYTQFYNRDLPSLPEITDPNQKIAARLQALLDLALLVGEDYFRVKPKGNLIDRCRRLEQAGWNRIYRQDQENLSPIEQGLANWTATEASLYMNHMRLVEQFAAVTGHYVKEKPTAERFAETLLIVANVINNIKGKNNLQGFNLGEQRVQITVGNPISVTARKESYQKTRRQAIADLTQDLQTGLEALIIQ